MHRWQINTPGLLQSRVSTSLLTYFDWLEGSSSQLCLAIFDGGDTDASRVADVPLDDLLACKWLTSALCLDASLVHFCRSRRTCTPSRRAWQQVVPPKLALAWLWAEVATDSDFVSSLRVSRFTPFTHEAWISDPGLHVYPLVCSVWSACLIVCSHHFISIQLTVGKGNSSHG